MNLTSKLLSLYLCLLVITNSTYAQNRFEPGIVIKLNGDTIHGLINNRDWTTVRGNITIKDSLTGVESDIPVTQIESFRLASGDYFVSRAIRLHYYTNDVDEIWLSKDTIVTDETLMLRVVYKGKANLYKYTDRKGLEHFFIEKEGVKADELLCYKRAVYNAKGERTGYISTIEKYKQSLGYYLADCPGISQKVASTSFAEKQLKNLFASYSKCFGQTEVSYTAEEKKVKWVAGLLAGVSRTTIHFESEENYDLANVTFPASTDFTGGGFLNIVLPNNFQRFAICNNFLLKKFYTDATGTSEDYRGPRITDRHYYFDYTYLKIATTFNIDITNTMVRPYVKLGIVNSFVISNKHYVPSTALDDNYLRNHEQGITLILGVKNRHFLFETSIEEGNGLEYLVNMSSSSETFNFLVGYAF